MGWQFFFRKRSGGDADSSAAAGAWWREANAAAEQPSRDVIDRLAAGSIAEANPSDEAERQAEMLDGLERVLQLNSAPALAVIATQHRVIGSETCHLVIPASLGEDGGASGKVFVTTLRVVIVGGPSVSSRPWHRVTHVVRTGRDVLLAGHAATDALHVRCNTYGDAMALVHIVNRLRNH